MEVLFLTSAGVSNSVIRDELLKLLYKPQSQLKLAYITTASKVEERATYVDRDRKVLADIGFQIEEFDIAGKKERGLREAFLDKDILYVQGGNTFYLLKQVKESGFDKVVREMVKGGKIYIGVSAGSYIACPSIEVSTWGRSSETVNNYGLSDLRAMNLVPFLLSVHYNREKYRDGLAEGIAKSKYLVKILTDDQALLVVDGVPKLIGLGDEVAI